MPEHIVYSFICPGICNAVFIFHLVPDGYQSLVSGIVHYFIHGNSDQFGKPALDSYDLLVIRSRFCRPVGPHNGKLYTDACFVHGLAGAGILILFQGSGDDKGLPDDFICFPAF
ncbi:MAG: hypothetical protein EOO88_54835 [Pedobacter sp.]|nr:MAG: hypothetical protein EOO88_54835 [Pedobacter sp.]